MTESVMCALKECVGNKVLESIGDNMTVVTSGHSGAWFDSAGSNTAATGYKKKTRNTAKFARKLPSSR